jgi:propanol-preferring alcohol dehydrogenase
MHRARHASRRLAARAMLPIAITMRSIELRAAGPIDRADVELVERPDVEPDPKQVLLSVRACAVCRTDLQLVEGDIPPRRASIVPGHQVIGVVLAKGTQVDDLRIGDRVGVGWLAGACGECRRCGEGRENLCEHARFTGWDVDGGFSTRMIADARYVFRIPARFDDLSAAPLMCGGVIGYRAFRLTGVSAGARLGLYGFGASARLAIQIAKHAGCETYVATRSARERERAIEMGAAWAGPYGERPPRELDAAITFAPSGDVVVTALKALGRGATLVVNAIHLDRIPEIAYEHLWWERSIKSVANYTRRDALEFLELAGSIPIRTEIEIHPLAEARVALERVANGDVRGAAVLDVR